MSARRVLNIWLVVSVFWGGMVCTTFAGEIIFVDADAPGPSHDGNSWPTAFKYLQDGIAVAQDSNEIWVAEGIYTPDSSSGNPSGTGDRTATFQLINGVEIYGGYAGFGEPDPNARDTNKYETILSGDLADNDGPDWQNYGENSYHVVTADGTDNSAILDGFTITAGNSTIKEGPLTDALGGGLIARSGSPTVTNCIISKNRCLDSESFGGGMYIGTGDPYSTFDGNPIITDCNFTGNRAACGGGLFSNATSPIISDCIFNGNHGTSDAGAIDSYGNITITDCIISGNSAGLGGGMALVTLFGSQITTVTNCVITGNSATDSGGGMAVAWPSSSIVTITNCTFYGNSAGNSGNGIRNGLGSTTVTNCIFWDGGDEIVIDSGGSVTVNYSDIQGGWSGVGVGNIDADPLFVNPINGDFRLQTCSPCINAGDNNAVPPEITTDLDGNPRIVNGIVDMGAYETPGLIEQILDFIDESVDEGTLIPIKPGKPGQGQLGALINMIEAAGNLIEGELLADACWQLQDAIEKTDGLSPPESAPDFVTGEAAEELASKIQELMTSLGCE